MRRKATADVDSLRIVDVVASFQLDSLVVVSSASFKTHQHEADMLYYISDYPCRAVMEAGKSHALYMFSCMCPRHVK